MEDKVVELVDGGCDINGATPSGFCQSRGCFAIFVQEIFIVLV